MKKFTFLLIALSFLTFVSIGQTTWYVSENGSDITGDGSSENAWATISYALAQTGVIDGDIIKLEGTITEDGAVTDGIIIQKSVTIKGEKYIYSTVQANDAYNTGDRRVFTIYPGYDVTFEHLIIKNGKSASNNYSAGILNYGNLTLEDCIIEDNFSSDIGGGIYQVDANLLINNCLIDGNIASYGGGGIYSEDSQLEITNSTIANNSCTEDLGNGGGIFFNSFSFASYCTIENSTIINNLVNWNSYGGGIYLHNQANTLTTEITNTTLTFNDGADGDGIYLNTESGATNNLTLLNCILDNGTSENYATTGAGTNNFTRTYTICRDASLPVTGAGNLNDTDPQLGTYGYNGGLTPTIPISSTSPAINAGTATNAPALDQRGSSRQGGYDIGSYEFTSVLAGDYIIDNTIATDFPTGTNFNSFEDAINALNFGGISSYVTFYVRPDQTFEEPPLLITTTGTESMPITFMTDMVVKGNAIVKGTGGINGDSEPSSESDMILTLYEVDHIIIEGIDFEDNETNSNATEKMEMGIVLFGTEYITIEDCSISLTTDESTTIGMVVVSATSNNNNNLITGNTIQNCIMGIGLFGDENLTSSNNEISNNTFTSLGDITSTYAVGIQAENQTNLSINYNDITQVTGNNSSYIVGISIDNSNAEIYDNSIEGIDGGGCIGLSLDEGTYSVTYNDINDFSSSNMSVCIMAENSDMNIAENYFENINSDGTSSGISTNNCDFVANGNYLYDFVGGSVIGFSIRAYDNNIQIKNDTLENFIGEDMIIGMMLYGETSAFEIQNNIFNDFSSVTNDCMIMGIFSNDENDAITSNFNIHNNKFFDFEINTTNGLVCAFYNNHDGNFIAHNNLIYNFYNSHFNTVDNFSIAAIIIGKGTNNLTYNTIYLDDEPFYANNLNTLLLFDGEAGSVLKMQNNIFTNNTFTNNNNIAVGFVNTNANLNFLSPQTNNNWLC